MAVVQLIASTMIENSVNFTASDRWDGYVCRIARDFPEGPFQGYQLNWGVVDTQTANNGFANIQYSGYNTNFNAINVSTLNAFNNSIYSGYNTNFGATDLTLLSNPRGVLDVDIDSVVDHPKDQTIYYKLKGWNPLTSSYETWVISEIITGRPPLDGGLFDPTPGRQPPNIERNVFTTPPSGNSLVNIVIAARWIE